MFLWFCFSHLFQSFLNSRDMIKIATYLKEQKGSKNNHKSSILFLFFFCEFPSSLSISTSNSLRLRFRFSSTVGAAASTGATNASARSARRFAVASVCCTCVRLTCAMWIHHHETQYLLLPLLHLLPFLFCRFQEVFTRLQLQVDLDTQHACEHLDSLSTKRATTTTTHLPWELGRRERRVRLLLLFGDFGGL
jgi:hypothetical protein